MSRLRVRDTNVQVRDLSTEKFKLAIPSKPPRVIRKRQTFVGWEKYSEQDVFEVLAYARSTEISSMLTGPSASPAIQPLHRLKLMNWIFMVTNQFNCSPETTHRTITLIDRYTHSACVSIDRYQLVSLVALWVACKVEERFVPEVHEILAACEEYQPHEVIACEQDMLRLLNWQVMDQTCVPVARMLVDLVLPNVANSTRQRVFYILELFALYHLGIERVPPTNQALAAVYLVAQMENVEWPDRVQQVLGQLHPMKSVVYAMAAYVTADLRAGSRQPFEGINTKFGRSRVGAITRIEWPNAEKLLGFARLASNSAKEQVIWVGKQRDRGAEQQQTAL